MPCPLVFNAVGSKTNPWFAMPFWWHMVLGGWAFGTVFMATDPVTAPFTNTGRWIYGLAIEALIVAIRVLNPAYPESVFLVILFMNVMAPLIDYLLACAPTSSAGGAVPRLDSPRYTFAFAAAVCVVCAALVSVAAVALQPRQKANARLECFTIERARRCHDTNAVAGLKMGRGV